jgi:signal transduction histidine kinase
VNVPALRSFGYTALLCVAIAIALWPLNPASRFYTTLLISCCIGFGINGAFVLLQNLVARFLPPYVAPLPITAIGLAAGLVAGGTLALGDPWFFFSEDWSTAVLAVFFAVVGFLLIGTRTQLAELRARLAEAEAGREKLEREALETQLRLLQAQIEPHFLFNVLSNIAGMIRADPVGAERTLANLSTLLRSSLRRTRASVTTLGEELDIIRAYLDIQQIRMGARLAYEIEIDDRLRHVPLPPMLVQPIGENAVRHGLDPLEEGGRLAIRVRETPGGVAIEVADTGRGIGANRPGPGTGLRNIRERLAGLYGGTATLRLMDNEPHGVCARLFVPVADAPQVLATTVAQ